MTYKKYGFILSGLFLIGLRVQTSVAFWSYFYSTKLEDLTFDTPEKEQENPSNEKEIKEYNLLVDEHLEKIKKFYRLNCKESREKEMIEGEIKKLDRQLAAYTETAKEKKNSLEEKKKRKAIEVVEKGKRLKKAKQCVIAKIQKFNLDYNEFEECEDLIKEFDIGILAKELKSQADKIKDKKAEIEKS